MLFSRIAFCGVDFSVCPDLLSNKWPGCRMSERTEDDACLPVIFCGDRGVACCDECGEFPCGEMKDFYGESESHRQAYERMRAVRGG